MIGTRSRGQSRATSGRFLATAVALDALFEHLSDVYFFVQDEEGRLLRVNPAFLDLLHLVSGDDSARDVDLRPASWTECDDPDDSEVVGAGPPIIEKAEFVRDSSGRVDWFLTAKLPIVGRSNRTIGVCGRTRDAEEMSIETLLVWGPVLETIVRHYAEPLARVVLAKNGDPSGSQFERHFSECFHELGRRQLR
jgi:hypothetical protein